MAARKPTAVTYQRSEITKVWGGCMHRGVKEPRVRGLPTQRSRLNRDMARTLLLWADGRETANILRNPGRRDQ